MSDRCPRCDSDELRTTSAGLNWLVECLACHHWWHVSDLELMRHV